MRGKKFLMVLLAAFFLSGCAKTQKDTLQEGESVQGNGMGRYMETTCNFVERLDSAIAIGMIDNSGCYILDTVEGIYEVDAKGPHVTKETVIQQEGLKKIPKDDVVVNAAISPNGDSAIVCLKAGSEKDMDAATYSYTIVGMDGTSKSLNLPNKLKEGGISQFWYKEDGTLYGSSYQGKIYEIAQDGESYQLVVDFASPVGHISFKNNIMILINGNGIFFYDLEKNEWIEDQVASDFIKKECEWEVLTENQYSILSFPGEGDAFYIACKQGLFRHTIGGNVMEKVIDGGLTSLGDTSQRLLGMRMVGEKEFAALYYGGKTAYYIYDPNISTLPDKILKVYSLRENAILNQTIHAYQAQNPDVFVKITIGIPENSSVTRDDAIKTLNTEIMANNGPDILVLDELPVEDYIEKGILKDISSIMHKIEQKEELFTNITNMYKEEKGTFAVPTLYRMTYLVGEKEKVEKVKDLTSLADMVEQLRQENPNGDIIGLYNEEQLIRSLAMASAPAWKDENGSINEEAVREFLTQAKRIYTAQMSGMKDTEFLNYIEEMSKEAKTGQYKEPLILMSEGFQKITFYCDYSKMFIGFTEWCLGYSSFSALQKYFKDSKEIAYEPFVAQSSNVYFPHSIMGIAASSANEEMTEEFLDLALSKEVQNAVAYGFPVNKASLQAKINKEVGIYFAAMPTGTIPKDYSFLIEWASTEEFANLQKQIEKADIAYVMGDILENVILEVAPPALNGEKSIDDAVKEIVSRAGIYMTE